VCTSYSEQKKIRERKSNFGPDISADCELFQSFVWNFLVHSLLKMDSKGAEFMNVNFVEVSGHIMRVLRFEVSVYTMFTLQTSFKSLSLGGAGGGG
jgi:hypothetical protein